MSQTDNYPGKSANKTGLGASVSRAFKLGLLLLLLLSLAACGKDNAEPTATVEPTATLESTATAASTAGEAQPTQPESPLAQSQGAEQAGAEQAASPTSTPVNVTVESNGTTAVFTPLEVDEGSKCDIEPHIDLAGYPNLEETLGCPIAEASTNPVAIDEFGEGPEYDRFMLWFSDLDPSEQITVLYPDNTWASFADTWQEGDPTFTCNPTDSEADSPPLPRRGFGKVWCENPELQEILGLVPKEERLCQHSVVQPFATGRLLACFEEATIRFFNINDDNTWQILVQ